MLISDLLDERSRILEELRAVETLLKTRFNWKPTMSTPDGGQQVLKGLESPAMDQDKSAQPARGAISYIKEARTWFEQVSQSEVTSGDFRDWLVSKYGAESVNNPGIQAGIRSLVRSKRLILIKKGVGRAHSIFTTIP